MNRRELEHIIRASGDVANSSDLIIVGSQAILGQFPDAPEECLISREADVYPKDDPSKAIEIDGTLGEGSLFHETHGYYAHGVGPETAILPRGYEDRLIPVKNENTRDVTGWCLEIHDLAASKLAAGREKDMDYVAVLLNHRLVDQKLLAERVQQLAKVDAVTHAQARLVRLIARPAY